MASFAVEFANKLFCQFTKNIYRLSHNKKQKIQSIK
jgi:hypothetical protein